MDPILVVFAFAVFISGIWERYAWRRDAKEREAQWAAERRELLTRIQHPEVIPMPQRKPVRQREARDTAAMAQVGRIQPPKDPA